MSSPSAALAPGRSWSKVRSAGAAPARDDVGRAVLFMVLAAVLLPLLNASSKYLSQTYPVLEITWTRYAGHFLFMLIAFAPRRGIHLLASSQPVLQLVRSTLLCVSTLVFIAGLASVMLPTRPRSASQVRLLSQPCRPWC